MRSIMIKAVGAAALALPFAGQATLYQFTASLSSANEVSPPISPIVSSATGFSVLFYDDFGTADNLADDLMSITTWANGLSAPLNNPAGGSAAHVHFPATPLQNAGAGVNLTVPAAPLTGSYSTGGNPGSVTFFSVVSGPAPTGTRNQNGVETTLIGALLDGLAYVNVHTTNYPAGEIRGQFNLVPTIPEPSTYALMLAGLGLVGWVAARRRKVGV